MKIRYSEVFDRNERNTVGRIDEDHVSLDDEPLSTLVGFGLIRDAVNKMADWESDHVEVVLDNESIESGDEWGGSALLFRNPETGECVVVAPRVGSKDEFPSIRHGDN